MRYLPLLLLLSIIISCTPSDATSTDEDQQALEESIARIENGLELNLQIRGIDSVQTYNIEDRLRELRIPGVSIAVLKDGEIAWARGYGMADSAENRPVTTETLFQAGSISKPMAALRAHQLVEQGMIHLDSNVNQYLTSWHVPDNEFTANEKVTIRRILNHTAGLTVWGFPGYPRGDTIPTVPEILDGLGNTDSVRVYKEPGGGWQYSGGGYTIMQLMITDLEKRTFPEIMKTEVLTPLGMERSTYENPLPARYHAQAATGYLSDGSPVEGKWVVYPEMAAAGLWTTPSELIMWAKEIQHIERNQQDGLLKVATVNEMLVRNEDDQGLGPVSARHYYGHGGADEGFRAELVVWKEAPVAVVMMVNSNRGNILLRELMISIAKEYDLPGYEPNIRTYNQQSEEQLAQYLGTYRFEEYGDAEMKLSEQGLEFSGEMFSSGSVYLLPESDTTFFNWDTGTYYNFRMEGGQVSGISVSNLWAEKVE